MSGSNNVDMNGLIGGVQAGYNWQAGNYLAGIEADFQGTGQDGLASFSNPIQPNGPGTAGTANVSIKETMPWLGTVRGRVGYVANQWLLYATGGLAYGRVTVDSSASVTGFLSAAVPGSLPCTGGSCPVWNFSGDGTTRTGWTAGGGVEWAMSGNWSVKFEYLFVDLGTFNTTFAGFPVCAGNAGTCNNTAAGTGNISSRVTDNIVRVGLNYQFH